MPEILGNCYCHNCGNAVNVLRYENKNGKTKFDVLPCEECKKKENEKTFDVPLTEEFIESALEPMTPDQFRKLKKKSEVSKERAELIQKVAVNIIRWVGDNAKEGKFLSVVKISPIKEHPRRGFCWCEIENEVKSELMRRGWSIESCRAGVNFTITA